MSYLYLFQRSDDPSLLKVGRSDNPSNRALALQKHHAFHILVLRVFQGKGTHEANAHTLLREYRVHNVPGCEWFRCSVEEALAAINKSAPITKSKDRPSRKARRRLQQGKGKYSRRYPEFTALYASGRVNESGPCSLVAA